MIGILTFYWADNFGALLQAYALKTYLNRSEETKMISYFPENLRSRYKIFHWKHRWQIKENIRLILHFDVFLKLVKRRWLMYLFRRDYLIGKRTKAIKEPSLIPGIYPKMNTYVVGSDQVWNPVIAEGIQDGYFCDFRGELKRKACCVAYAASLGNDRLEKRFDDTLKTKLQNFDAISVREESAVPYISELYGKPVSAVLDPVFLLERDDWEALIRMQKKVEPNIFVYFTEENPKMISYAISLKAFVNCPVCVLCERSIERWPESICDIRASGPVEFLTYLRDAAFVVTNSFHALAFSILFQKQFAVFKCNNNNTRLYDLLKLSGLEDRVVRDTSSFLIEEKIDWDAVSKRLESYIHNSRDFISQKIFSE